MTVERHFAYFQFEAVVCNAGVSNLQYSLFLVHVFMYFHGHILRSEFTGSQGVCLYIYKYIYQLWWIANSSHCFEAAPALGNLLF